MTFVRRLIAKLHEKKVAKYLSVEEKEELYKAGYSLKQLHLTDEEMVQFEKDGLIRRIPTMAFKPRKRKARHDHCITLND